MLGKLAVAVSTRRHVICVLNVSSVLGDSQISLTQYRGQLIAAIQLAVSRDELYLSRCCALTDWSIRVGK